MLSAHSIVRRLMDDDNEELSSVPPSADVDDLDFDPKAEIARYAQTPFRVPGSGPTTTYQHFLSMFQPGRRYRAWEGIPGTRAQKLSGVKTYLIDYGDRIAVRYHQTDVVTAFRDGKVVVDAGGWHPQGSHAAHGWTAQTGRTTADRIGHMGSTAGGWRIYQLKGAWYWWNFADRQGDLENIVRYPYTDGDTIHADGSLQMQADPVYVKRRRKT